MAEDYKLGPFNITVLWNLLSPNLTRTDEVWRLILACIVLAIAVVIPSAILIAGGDNKTPIFDKSLLGKDPAEGKPPHTMNQAIFIAMGSLGLAFATVLLFNLVLPVQRADRAYIKGRNIIERLVNLIKDTNTTSQDVRSIVGDFRRDLSTITDKEKLNVFNKYIDTIKPKSDISFMPDKEDKEEIEMKEVKKTEKAEKKDEEYHEDEGIGEDIKDETEKKEDEKKEDEKKEDKKKEDKEKEKKEDEDTSAFAW
jgi:hypothetical protein